MIHKNSPETGEIYPISSACTSSPAASTSYAMQGRRSKGCHTLAQLALRLPQKEHSFCFHQHKNPIFSPQITFKIYALFPFFTSKNIEGKGKLEVSKSSRLFLHSGPSLQKEKSQKRSHLARKQIPINPFQNTTKFNCSRKWEQHKPFKNYNS